MSASMLLRAAARIAGWRTHRTLAAFRRGLADAPAVQERVLAGHVAASSDSRFGADFGLKSIGSYADFVRQVPRLDYDKLAPYIEPLKGGDPTSLFNPGTRIRMFAMTSGTTGSAKFLPVTDRYLVDYRRAWNAWGIANYDDHPAAWLRPILHASSPMDEQVTTAGIPCGAISGFIHRHQLAVVKRFYVVPDCVGYIKDAAAKSYAVMRLAAAGDVAMIATANPSTPLKLAKVAQQHAAELVRDIRDGTLRADLDIEPRIRAELARHLKPDPQRASTLDRLASSHGALLPKHIWNLAVMTNWTGGTVGLYVRNFAEYFGDVPVRDLGLIASEGRVTVPLADATPAGALEIYGTFFEFIPADQVDRPQPDVLRCHELTAGSDYFVLMTTGGGLFRYHIGDVVRCEGFEGKTPLLAFLNKGKHTSSITGEKLTEHQVVAAADQVARQMGLDLGDFVLCPRWAATPYYAMNVEHSRLPAGRRDELAARIDTALAEANVEYEQKRDSGRLAAVVVAPVADGFFARLHEKHVRQRQGRREQYKHQFLYTDLDGDREFPRLPGNDDATTPREERRT